MDEYVQMEVSDQTHHLPQQQSDSSISWDLGDGIDELTREQTAEELGYQVQHNYNLQVIVATHSRVSIISA